VLAWKPVFLNGTVTGSLFLFLFPWPNEGLTVRVGDCTWTQWSVRMVTYINQIGCGNLLYVSHVQLYSRPDPQSAISDDEEEGLAIDRLTLFYDDDSKDGIRRVMAHLIVSSEGRSSVSG
jgi:hypothetical protein